MCWQNYTRPVQMVAEKDVPVFKIGAVSTDGNVKSYFFRNNCYREGQTYEENNVKVKFIHEMPHEKYFIDMGLHSYAVSNVRLKPSWIRIVAGVEEFACVQVITNRCTKMSPDVIVNGQWYGINNVAIMLCVIPKGATYYVNSVGEVVSNKLNVVEIIKEPFSINRDGTTSARSVDKINKAIDKWEDYVNI